MNPLQNALIFILESVLSLYIIALILRLILQLFRVSFRNPICEIIMKVTNPVILPLRKFIPGLFKIDLASVVAIVLFATLKVLLIRYLYGLGFGVNLALFLAIIGDILNTAIQIAFVAVIAQAIMSWFQPNPYNPAVQFVHSLAEPINRPARKLIPSFSGLDISPIFTILGLSVLQIVVVEPLMGRSFY